MFGEKLIKVKDAKKLKLNGLELSKDKDEVLIYYPKIIVSEDYIKMFDPDYKLNFHHKLSKSSYAFINPKEKVLVISKGKDNKNVYFNIIQLDDRGNSVWKKEIKSKEGRNLQLSNDGERYLLNNRFSFSFYTALYTINGQKIWEHDTTNEDSMGISTFLEDGRVVAIYNDLLYLVDKNGKKLWESTLNEVWPELTGIITTSKTDQGINRFVVSLDKMIYVFEDSGELWNATFPAFNNDIRLSNDGNILVGINNNGLIWCRDAANGNVIWQLPYGLMYDVIDFDICTINKEKTYVALTYRKVAKVGSIYKTVKSGVLVINNTGNAIYHIPAPSPNRVNFLNSNKCIAVITSEEINLYSLELETCCFFSK